MTYPVMLHQSRVTAVRWPAGLNVPILVLGLIGLLSACSPAQATISPTPEVYALRVGYSPDVRPALPALEQCAGAQPDVALLVDEIPVTSMQSAGAELWLRVGIPDSWDGYAVQLASEHVSVVINPENPTRSLNFEEIQSIFNGQIQSWDQVGGPGQPIRVWVLPPADEARQIIDQHLLANQPISDQAFLATGPQRMLEAVANDPGAIGYLPQAWIDNTVKNVPLPSSQQSMLTEPLLALYTSQPEGQVRAFLACLQNGAGQKSLANSYEP